MSRFERSSGFPTARIVWSLVGLAAVGLLAISFVMAGRALVGQEEGAEARAVVVTNTVLSDSLTPQMVSKPIPPPEYRALMSAVAGGILSDDRVERVRVWRKDGTLVFSSDQRDDVGHYSATGDTRIRAAASGRTQSTVTGPSVASAGLAGTEEKLYQTFVPLRLAGTDGVAGVAEIDQRYGALRSAASRVWLPMQIGLGALAIFAVVMLARALSSGSGRAGPRSTSRSSSSQDAGVPFEAMELAAQLAKAKEAVAQADERARRAERALKEQEAKVLPSQQGLQEKVIASEKRLAEAMEAFRKLQLESKRAVVRVPELEAEVRRLQEIRTPAPANAVEDPHLAERLREAEAERHRMAGELERLRAVLSEREAELGLARNHAEAGAEKATRSEEQARRAEEGLAELEARASGAEAELRTVRQELEQMSLGLREAEGALADSSARAASLEAVARQVEEDQRATRAELERATIGLTEREAEIARLRQSLASGSAETQQQAAGAQQQAAEAQQRADEAERRAQQAEAARAELAGELARVLAERPEIPPADARATELDLRVQQLEEQRRQDVSELQRTHEALANTQFELTQAMSRAKDAEARLEQLEAEGATPPDVDELATSPEPRIPAGRGTQDTRDPEPERVLEEATIASRLSRALSRRARSEPETTAAASAAEVEEPDPGAAASVQPPDEGLSLRERLARAAAARHRVSGSDESDER